MRSWDHIKNLAVQYCGARPPASWAAPQGREAELANLAFYDSLDATLYSHVWLEAYRELSVSSPTLFIPNRRASTHKYRGKTIADDGTVTIYETHVCKELAAAVPVGRTFSAANEYEHGDVVIYSGAIYRYTPLEAKAAGYPWDADQWVQLTDPAVPAYDVNTFYAPGELCSVTAGGNITVYIKKSQASAGTATTVASAWDLYLQTPHTSVVRMNQRKFLRLVGLYPEYEYEAPDDIIIKNGAISEEVVFRCVCRVRPNDLRADPLLVDAVALHLGAKIALPLKAELNVAGKLTAEYAGKIREAKNRDAMDRSGKPLESNFWGEQAEPLDNWDNRRG